MRYRYTVPVVCMVFAVLVCILMLQAMAQAGTAMSERLLWGLGTGLFCALMAWLFRRFLVTVTPDRLVIRRFAQHEYRYADMAAIDVQRVGAVYGTGGSGTTFLVITLRDGRRARVSSWVWGFGRLVRELRTAAGVPATP